MGTTYHLSNHTVECLGETPQCYVDHDPSYHVGKMSGGIGFTWAMSPRRYAEAVIAYMRHRKKSPKAAFVVGDDNLTLTEFMKKLQEVEQVHDSIGKWFC